MQLCYQKVTKHTNGYIKGLQTSKCFCNIICHKNEKMSRMEYTITGKSLGMLLFHMPVDSRPVLELSFISLVCAFIFDALHTLFLMLF